MGRVDWPKRRDVGRFVAYLERPGEDPALSELRSLKFESLDDAVTEAQSLLESGYTRMGKWSLGQVCDHLCRVQDPSIDGYPKWFSLFAFLRPVMRWLFLPKLAAGRPMPRGIPTASMFVPAGELGDTEQVERFAKSVERIKSHVGDFQPHPAFGRMNSESIQKVHAHHAAHHLRFLSPATPDPAEPRSPASSLAGHTSSSST